MSKLRRRDILKIGALAAAASGFPAILRAQSKEIVILGLWDQTGAFADVGPLNDRGMRMALEERATKSPPAAQKNTPRAPAPPKPAPRPAAPKRRSTPRARSSSSDPG